MTAEKSRLKLNFVVLLAAQAYGQVLAALAGLLTVRLLGPTEYGRYTLAVTGLNLGAVVADAGLSAYLGREAARLDVAAGWRLWRQALGLRLGLSGLVWLVMIGLALVWSVVGQPGLVGLAGLSLFPLGVIILTTAFLNGQGRTPLSAGLSAGVGTLSFGLSLAGLWWWPVAGIALVTTLIANLIGVGLLVRPLRKVSAGLKVQPDQSTPITLWRASRSFWLIGLAAIIFQYADIYLVSVFLDLEGVGQYGAALRLLALMTTIPTVWGVVAVPRFARQPGRLRAELRRWGLGLSLAGVALAGLGLAATVPLVEFGLGSKYAQAAHTLVWLGWAAAGIFASAAPVTWLTVTNRQHLILVALLVADLVGLLLVAGLVGGLGWGLNGVAVARVVTSWTLCGLYFMFGRTRAGAKEADYG